MTICNHSGIDGNGQEHITVEIEKPKINNRGLYEGGKFLLFVNEHVKQKAYCMPYTRRNGCPKFDNVIREWKGEILVESECLEFAKEWVSKNG